MSDVDVMNTVIDVIIYGGIPLLTGRVAKLFLIDFPRIDQKASEKLDRLQDSYSDNMGRDELVAMYHDAISVYHVNRKKRPGEVDELLAKIESQLQPYIRDEVKASVDTVTFDDHTSPEELCERLSPTYRDTFASERKRQEGMNRVL